MKVACWYCNTWRTNLSAIMVSSIRTPMTRHGPSHQYNGTLWWHKLIVFPLSKKSIYSTSKQLRWRWITKMMIIWSPYYASSQRWTMMRYPSSWMIESSLLIRNQEKGIRLIKESSKYNSYSKSKRLKISYLKWNCTWLRRMSFNVIFLSLESR